MPSSAARAFSIAASIAMRRESPLRTYSSTVDSVRGSSCDTDTKLSLPGTEYSPASAPRSPRSSASRLDLPHPFRPTIPILSPRKIVRLALSKRICAPRRRRRSRSSSIDWFQHGGAILSGGGAGLSGFDGRLTPRGNPARSCKRTHFACARRCQMKRLLAAMLLLGCAAATQAGTAVPTIEIVVPDGRTFREIPVTARDGAMRSYLEAERGARYEVRVRNTGGERLGLVIAVDGRNIINGKKSDLARGEPMYVLGGWDTQSYAGWRANLDAINEF